jgi:hypothetical protein
MFFALSLKRSGDRASRRYDVSPVRRRMQKSLRCMRFAARLDRFTGFHAGAQTALFN